MDLMAFLTECERLETLARDLYRRLATHFRTHRAAFELFDGLAKDEERHAQAYRFLRSVVRESDRSAEVDPLYLRRADAFRRSCARAEAALQEGCSVCLDVALRLCLRLEASSVEAHSLSFVRTVNPQVTQLLESIVVADKAHVAELERFGRLHPALEERATAGA